MLPNAGAQTQCDTQCDREHWEPELGCRRVMEKVWTNINSRVFVFVFVFVIVSVFVEGDGEGVVNYKQQQRAGEGQRALCSKLEEINFDIFTDLTWLTNFPCF